MIIAIAGRRVDAANSQEPRFPLKNVELVKERVRAMLESEGAKGIACSAACGADLVGLEVAGELHLRRRVILPFSEAQFREGSVVDRPGDWGPLYDEVVSEVKAAGDLVFLKEMPEDEAYVAANLAILDEAAGVAKESGDAVTAALIWNKQSRGADDITEQFGTEARKRGWRVIEVSTLES
jgi:hypothetical protein